jgi:alcohol dehydrogenase class IV
VAYNESATAGLLRPLADILGANSAAQGLFDFEVRLNAPRALAELGMPEDGLAAAADEIASSPYWNPRPVERDGVLRLLEDAFAGRRPAA